MTKYSLTPVEFSASFHVPPHLWQDIPAIFKPGFACFLRKKQPTHKNKWSSFSGRQKGTSELSSSQVRTRSWSFSSPVPQASFTDTLCWWREGPYFIHQHPDAVRSLCPHFYLLRAHHLVFSREKKKKWSLIMRRKRYHRAAAAVIGWRANKWPNILLARIYPAAYCSD